MARLGRIELGKTPLRFDSASARAATLALQFHVPPAQLMARKLKISDGAELVRQLDDDAITIFMAHGYRHVDRNITINDIDRLFDDYLRGGGKRSDFAIPIIDALEDAGMIETERKSGDEEAPTESFSRPPMRLHQSGE